LVFEPTDTLDRDLDLDTAAWGGEKPPAIEASCFAEANALLAEILG